MNTFFRRPIKKIILDLIIIFIVTASIISIDRLALTYSRQEEMSQTGIKLSNCVLEIKACQQQAETQFRNDGDSFYVSSNGTENPECDISTPCLNFEHAESLAQPGDTIYLTGSLESITITKSGQENAPITIRGNNAILNGLIVNGDYIHVYNIEVVGADSHGILVQSKHILIQDSIVRNSVTENGENNQCGMEEEISWGSGLKIRIGAEDVTLRGNKVFHNCGEGIAITRGVRILLENNIVGSNYSVGIYIDNSYEVVVKNNVVTCDDTYLREDNRMSGIIVAGELYEGWGMQLHDIQILNNTVSGCYDNYASWTTDDESPTINLLIEGNISINSVRRSIDMDSISENIVVSNNLVDKPIHYDEEDEGLTLINNRVISSNP
ncbi:MAG: right-handed parallel beta-helix repeat-containing protein [Anaerolineales bacterium]|nr:right-handed parallel beta-helix repeat-containing protein [Anaerolineales bacterium]